MGLTVLLLLFPVLQAAPQPSANKEGFGLYIVWIIMGLFLVYMIHRMSSKKRKENELSQEFEIRMRNRGFTKRIVVYDFLSQYVQRAIDRDRNNFAWTVGLWIDYQKQLIAIRTDKDTLNEIDIPFDIIQSVEIIEDGFSRMSGGTMGYGGIAIGSARSQEFCEEYKIRIVTRNKRTGTQAHILTLFGPGYGTTKLKKSEKHLRYYACIAECARSIVDEIENIMNHTK